LPFKGISTPFLTAPPPADPSKPLTSASSYRDPEKESNGPKGTVLISFTTRCMVIASDQQERGNLTVLSGNHPPQRL